MTTPDLADHTQRVRSELERYRPESTRWQAARDLAIAAIDRATLPNSDNAERTQPRGR